MIKQKNNKKYHEFFDGADESLLDELKGIKPKNKAGNNK